MKWIVAAALLALASWPADAASCKKGIPCGGSCISATKVCRISLPSTTAAPAAKKSTPAASSTGNTQQPAEYGDLVPATITCPKGRVLLAGSQPPMCARLRTGPR